MKNITLTLDDQTAARVRVEAARKNVSISKFVGDMLQERLREAREYNEAMNRFFSSTFVIQREPGERLPTRDDLHDRSRSDK